ncbi:outer membrane transport energization protein TonB [Pedobacter psychrotolerans]|uniref:Cell envelope biogenesis protein TonB n=1 Tax=Pedobacter psychrotolerans TaxID=1843235 RepID=A0A4R2HDM4_9SPHI|nr:TonB family protein [Pedobacter psychrotolerans]TCO23871.1 outer membrane transport energization protein TonB [Pedobacter psychrotolerans]GGE63234.1 cell envelope biogenesis protein TonB [Pedobacter psychrotolerans]
MSFAHYLLQVNLYLIVFYGFYKLLLDKETYFLLNRIYLVVSGLLSLCIPFIRLEWITRQEAAQKVYTTVNWGGLLEKATIVPDQQTVLSWPSALVFIYFTGVLFFLGKLVINLLVVKNLINYARAGSAFSFFSRKVIDENLPLSNVIDVHEDTHVKQWHTLDILFFEVLGILTWINPFIYLYKKSIKNIHEFLADQQAAEFQGDKADYAMLILSHSFGVSPNSLTNGFFEKSLIKKRIFMLQKERSKKMAIMKYGFFIPLFAILIIFSSATIRKNKKLIALSDQIPLEKPIEIMQDMVAPKNESLNETSSKNVILSSGEKVDANWNGFYRFLARTIKYPSEAHQNNLQGNAQIKFTLQNNKVTQISSVVDLGDGCNEEVMKAILSYRSFKNVPNGKYTLAVGFRLTDHKSAIKNRNFVAVPSYQKLSAINIVGYSATQKDNLPPEKVFDFVSIDQQPEFPGGITKFYEYLGKSIKYPVLAQQNNVQGKVFLSFIVERDGKLSDVNITHGLGSGTDEEAVRVVSGSPRWNPGIADGKTVRVKYNLNVNFKLNTGDESATPSKTQNSILKSNQNVGFIKTKDGAFKGVIVIDGTKLADKEVLYTMNQNNIESVNVLKGNMATDLYGAEAKEGVMLITTKKGKTNLFRDLNQKEINIDKGTTVDYLRKKF